MTHGLQDTEKGCRVSADAQHLSAQQHQNIAHRTSKFHGFPSNGTDSNCVPYSFLWMVGLSFKDILAVSQKTIIVRCMSQ